MLSYSGWWIPSLREYGEYYEDSFQFRFVSRPGRSTVAGIFKYGGVYDADTGTLSRLFAVGAWRERFLSLGLCSASFGGRYPDERAGCVCVGSEGYLFDRFAVETDGTLEFSTDTSVFFSGGECNGDVVLRIDPSERSAKISLRLECGAGDMEVCDTVFREYSSRCTEHRRDGGETYYRCEVSFVPRYGDPRSACDFLKSEWNYDDYSLVSCGASGDRAVAVVEFSEDDYKQVSNLCDVFYESPEELASALVAYSLYNEYDVEQCFREDLNLGDEWYVEADVEGSFYEGYTTYIRAHSDDFDLKRLGDFL